MKLSNELSAKILPSLTSVFQRVHGGEEAQALRCQTTWILILTASKNSYVRKKKSTKENFFLTIKKEKRKLAKWPGMRCLTLFLNVKWDNNNNRAITFDSMAMR